jgi:hypothetical protein
MSASFMKRCHDLELKSSYYDINRISRKNYRGNPGEAAVFPHGAGA